MNYFNSVKSLYDHYKNFSYQKILFRVCMKNIYLNELRRFFSMFIFRRDTMKREKKIFNIVGIILIIMLGIDPFLQCNIVFFLYENMIVVVF
jgi:hypothetical protein